MLVDRQQLLMAHAKSRLDYGRDMVAGTWVAAGYRWRAAHSGLQLAQEALRLMYASLFPGGGGYVTHGRHCTCSACAREDWASIVAPCGMHGPGCPGVYAPLGSAGAHYPFKPQVAK